MAMDIDTALHELLLTRPVTENDIVLAHRRMAVRFHPDKAADPDERLWAQRKFVLIQAAYELLKGLPIETINTPPSPKACVRPREVSVRRRAKCAAWQARRRVSRLSRRLTVSVVRLANEAGRHYRVAAVGLIFLSVVFFLRRLPDTPQEAAGSPVPLAKDATEMIVGAASVEDAAAAGEFLRTFGRLMKIGYDPNDRCVAYFERIAQPIHNRQVTHGFRVNVLPDYVVFFKEDDTGAGGAGICRLPQ